MRNAIDVEVAHSTVLIVLVSTKVRRSQVGSGHDSPVRLARSEPAKDINTCTRAASSSQSHQSSNFAKITVISFSTMGLMDLPTELITEILAECMVVRGYKRAVRLRLVNSE